MKTVSLTPDSFVKIVLEAHDASDFVLPALFNLTTDKFAIVDQTFRERYLKAAKIDLSFLNDAELDIGHFLGDCIESVSLEPIAVGDQFGDTVVTSTEPDRFYGDYLQRSFNALQWALGFELLDLQSVALSSIDDKLVVEINNSPYFTGTISVSC